MSFHFIDVFLFLLLHCRCVRKNTSAEGSELFLSFLFHLERSFFFFFFFLGEVDEEKEKKENAENLEDRKSSNSLHYDEYTNILERLSTLSCLKIPNIEYAFSPLALSRFSSELCDAIIDERRGESEKEELKIRRTLENASIEFHSYLPRFFFFFLPFLSPSRRVFNYTQTLFLSLSLCSTCVSSFRPRLCLWCHELQRAERSVFFFFFVFTIVDRLLVTTRRSPYGTSLNKWSITIHPWSLQRLPVIFSVGVSSSVFEVGKDYEHVNGRRNYRRPSLVKTDVCFLSNRVK